MSKKKAAWITGAALATAVGVATVAQVGLSGSDGPRQPQTTAKGSVVVAHGQNAPMGKFGFTVMLSFPNVPAANGTSAPSSCSGVLIAKQWVATAGGCFHDLTVARTRVSGKPRYDAIAAVGQTSIKRADGERIAVDDVRQNPKVNFALAHLTTPVQNTDPIALSTSVPKVAQKLRLAGWGIDRDTPDQPADLSDRPDRLQTGLVKTSRVTADSVFVKGVAPSKDTSACPLDFGAPYFTRTADGTAHLVATEVGGPACPHAQEEQAARVDTLIPWISQQDPTIPVAKQTP